MTIRDYQVQGLDVPTPRQGGNSPVENVTWSTRDAAEPVVTVVLRTGLHCEMPATQARPLGVAIGVVCDRAEVMAAPVYVPGIATLDVSDARSLSADLIRVCDELDAATSLDVPAHRPTGPVNAAAALRWLSDYAEMPEGTPTDDLLRAARRNAAHEPAGHPDRERIALCAELLAAQA